MRLPRSIYNAFIQDMVRVYRILPHGFRRRLLGIFTIQFVHALLETSTILVISFFGISLAAADRAKENLIVRALFGMFPPLEHWVAEPRTFVGFACLLVVFFIIIKNLFAYLSFKTSSQFSEDITYYITQETLQRYLNKNYLWHISPKSNDIMNRMNSRSQLASLLGSLLALYSNIFCCIALFISLFIAEPQLTLVVMVVLGGVCFSTYMALRRRIDCAGQEVYQTNGEFFQAMNVARQGVREVLIYRQQEIFLDRITFSLRQGLPSRVFLAFSHSAPAWLLEVAGFSTICGVTFYLIINGTPMPEIIRSASMLMLTAWRILPAVNRVLAYSVTIRGIRPQAMGCLELLETFLQEDPGPLPQPDPNFKFERNIVLKEVSFNYPSSKKESLSHLSLRIGKGQSVGLIGLSGAGKSTLALLLSGLVQPHSGEMLIDDRPVDPAAWIAYRQKVGYVPQSPLLMPGTVADNVAFSQWGRKYDRDRVLEACRMAAMDFILSSEKGIDTPVGGSGGGLSGGQIQRVSIARALFTRPDIMIFDEATSALDQASENVIKHTIENIKSGITAIIIAHRLSTVENCDVLFWLENGRLKESGPPSKILPLYQQAMNIP